MTKGTSASIGDLTMEMESADNGLMGDFEFVPENDFQAEGFPEPLLVSQRQVTGADRVRFKERRVENQIPIIATQRAANATNFNLTMQAALQHEQQHRIRNETLSKPKSKLKSKSMSNSKKGAGREAAVNSIEESKTPKSALSSHTTVQSLTHKAQPTNHIPRIEGNLHPNKTRPSHHPRITPIRKHHEAQARVNRSIGNRSISAQGTRRGGDGGDDSDRLTVEESRICLQRLRLLCAEAKKPPEIVNCTESHISDLESKGCPAHKLANLIHTVEKATNKMIVESGNSSSEFGKDSLKANEHHRQGKKRKTKDPWWLDPVPWWMPPPPEWGPLPPTMYVDFFHKSKAAPMSTENYGPLYNPGDYNQVTPMHITTGMVP
uniref:Uncharacterized protein n=1 Tax=Amorphochlora amoebiformis TaxID=1561963 RepID=A0A7S0DSI3_9EUKA